jgi:shikimate dehydrogenase
MSQLMTKERVVTGKTRVAGILGWPVEHTLSPAMHNGEFERLGLDWVYVAFPVDPENLESAFNGLSLSGIAGLNITIPHKQKIMALLDEISDEAQSIGAVNTVKFENGRAIGYNTDVHGWAEDIQQDILIQNSSVCILGAGGAGRALGVGAALAGARSVLVLNRSRENADAVCDILVEQFPEVDFVCTLFDSDDAREQFQACEIIVNATPVGMTSKPGLPIPADWLSPNQYIYDTIYVPAETELMKAARRKGCPVRGGLGMLARQGARAFEIWTGKKPDVDRMESTLRRILSGKD